MPDDLAALLAEMAPAEAVTPTEPATPAPSAAGIESKPDTDWEARFKGLQRTLSEKDRAVSDLQKQMEDLRMSSLSEDEREAFARRREADEVAALRAENELLKLAAEPKYASVYAPFSRLLKAQTAQEQLDILGELLAPKSDSAPAREPETAPVDPNNPRRSSAVGTTLPNGQVMNDELARRILEAASGANR